MPKITALRHFRPFAGAIELVWEIPKSYQTFKRGSSPYVS